jgi:hypothetical protein
VLALGETAADFDDVGDDALSETPDFGDVLRQNRAIDVIPDLSSCRLRLI